jgi:hypothetical protein
VLSRTPVFSPLTHPQISSRERRLVAIFNKLTMPHPAPVTRWHARTRPRGPRGAGAERCRARQRCADETQTRRCSAGRRSAPMRRRVQDIVCEHQASVVSRSDTACGNAAVACSHSVRRRTPEDPGPSYPRYASLPSSSRQQPSTGCESAIVMRADRPTRIHGTKPFWKVGKAIVGFAGISVAHFGGDKALVLCQGGTHGNAPLILLS